MFFYEMSEYNLWQESWKRNDQHFQMHLINTLVIKRNNDGEKLNKPNCYTPLINLKLGLSQFWTNMQAGGKTVFQSIKIDLQDQSTT